jgi:hypothetical protein
MSDANHMWKASNPYPSDGEHWYQKGWVLYLLCVLIVLLWLIFRGLENDTPERSLSAGDTILHEDQLR